MNLAPNHYQDLPTTQLADAPVWVEAPALMNGSAYSCGLCAALVPDTGIEQHEQWHALINGGLERAVQSAFLPR